MDFMCSICSEVFGKPSGLPKQNGTSNLHMFQKSIVQRDLGVENILGTLCGHAFHECCLRRIFKNKR